MGISQTVQELIAVVRLKSTRLVLLSETHTSGTRVSNLLCRLGLKHCITVDSSSTGGCGGLALFWHESIEVNLFEKHKRFIDVHVRECASTPWFRVTFVCGEPRREERHNMWDLMHRL